MNIRAVDEKVYSTADVHVRESYGTDSPILGTVKKGESLERTGICDNGWFRVVYNNKDAYVFGDYLSTKAPASDAPAAKTDGKPVEQPAPVQQPQEEHQTVTGTVVDVSMNTLTFSADEANYTVYIADGVEMTFSKEDAVDNTGGLSQGLEIVVTADANSADSGSNIMPAKQIDLME